MSSAYCTKIGLGTVQFGLDYGISNKNGQVAETEVARILQTAAENGVNVLDTAAAYGTSEEVLGKTLPKHHRFNIVTKIPKISEDISDVPLFVKTTFENSLQKIRQRSLYSLMFHSADDLNTAAGEQAYKSVAQLKAEGLIQKIGVSAYTQQQLETVRQRFAVDLVQVPVSILDQRLVQSGYLQNLHDSGIEVHSRSAFLQGLVLMKPDEVKTYFEPLKPVLHRLHQTAAEHRITPLELSLRYVLNIESITAVITGVTSQKEFIEIAAAAQHSALPLDIDFAPFRVDDVSMLNPALWK